jgi:hypothetical protein
MSLVLIETQGIFLLNLNSLSVFQILILSSSALRIKGWICAIESVDASFSGEQAALSRFGFRRGPTAVCPFSLLLRVGEGRQYAVLRFRGEGDSSGMLVGTGMSVMI